MTIRYARNAASCMLAATLALGVAAVPAICGCAGTANDTAVSESEDVEATTTEAGEVEEVDVEAADGEAATPEATATEGAPIGLEEGWPGVERPHEYGMSDGEAVFDAREHLGIAAEDVEDLDVTRVWYEQRGCYQVSMRVKGSDATQSVLVDAQTGDVLATW